MHCKEDYLLVGIYMFVSLEMSMIQLASVYNVHDCISYTVNVMLVTSDH